jgi:Outer membrane lipoprotein-sorting protein
MNRTLIVFLMAAGAAMAQDGRQIMQEVQKRHHSTSMRCEATLQTTTDGKHLTTRRWLYEQIGDFGDSKAIVRFTGPDDVKDVALLIVNHPDSASDQWIWRPKDGKEQRVAPGDRSDRFLGTDFTYEDLEARVVDQFDYTVTGEVNGMWRIDAKPKKASQYTHSYFWIDKTNYTFQRIEDYNKKGLAKTIDYTDFAMVDGIWTAKTVLVLDVFKKSRTGLKYDKIEYNVPLKEEAFAPEALGRTE